MQKLIHELRDPIHTFIKYDSEERKVIDSLPFQRLRYISQLAFTYLVYPGATHKRFEHSLGVMELATRIFDTLLEKKDLKKFFNSDNEIKYWRKVLRMAALCHDIGHLPFSHAAEKELLPQGYTHERMTKEIICSSEMENIWQDMTPSLNSKDIYKIAIGAAELAKFNDEEKDNFSVLDKILSEIITSDTFGADRMDYLLRDSYHAGVVYGQFGHYRLIDTLRVLPDNGYNNQEYTLGVEEGGLHSSEALLLARYFMFSQLYFHDVRRIYDIHLRDFLSALFPDKFPIEVEEYLNWTDEEILSEIKRANKANNHPGHFSAKIIVNRHHFKLLYKRLPGDLEINLNPVETIYNAIKNEFGEENFRYDPIKSEGGESPNFPILLDDGSICSAFNYSQVLKNIPTPIVDFLFASREIYSKAKDWIEKNKEDILK